MKKNEKLMLENRAVHVYGNSFPFLKNMIMLGIAPHDLALLWTAGDEEPNLPGRMRCF